MVETSLKCSQVSFSLLIPFYLACSWFSLPDVRFCFQVNALASLLNYWGTEVFCWNDVFNLLLGFRMLHYWFVVVGCCCTSASWWVLPGQRISSSRFKHSWINETKKKKKKNHRSLFVLVFFFLRKSIQDLNWQRKNMQLTAGAKLREMESTWVAGIFGTPSRSVSCIEFPYGEHHQFFCTAIADHQMAAIDLQCFRGCIVQLCVMVTVNGWPSEWQQLELLMWIVS